MCYMTVTTYNVYYIKCPVLLLCILKDHRYQNIKLNHSYLYVNARYLKYSLFSQPQPIHALFLQHVLLKNVYSYELAKYNGEIFRNIYYFTKYQRKRNILSIIMKKGKRKLINIDFLRRLF